MKHWPGVKIYGDIKTIDFTGVPTVDILTGGFPCQPYSMAGKRKGKEDTRHLWPEMLRTIREVQPRWVVGENVFGLVNWNGGMVFHEVQADLEAAGYEVWPYVLAAASVGAPHRRDRIWFVAYAKKYRCNQRGEGINGRKEHQFQNRDKIRDVTATNGEESNAPNPDGVRLQQRKNTGEMAKGQTKMGGQRSEPTNAIETNGKAANAPHPNGNGFNQCNGNDEKQPGKGGFNAFGDADTSDEYGDVADTDGIRLRGQSNRFGKSKFVSKNDSGNYWESFPTQSPVCTGNDGLPPRLDGITFSKWRNESIKAAGNAIVPQVVLPIFKAIQEYENLYINH
jgi:DNA (cytosine-5)-methyltransferase 1